MSAFDVIHNTLTDTRGWTAIEQTLSITDALKAAGYAIVQKPHPPSGFEACSGAVWSGE